jgi:predicted outer membrane repeat protein
MNYAHRSFRLGLSASLALSQLAVAVFGMAPPLPARAVALTVTNANDSGSGSLRQALVAALPGDTITFNLPADTTIAVSAPLTVTQPITLDGSTATNLRVSGGGGTRVFDVTAPATFNGFTVLAGNATESLGGNGGGVASSSALTLTGMTFLSNTAISGGGIYAQGQLIIDASRFEGNTALVYGGAVATADETIVKSASFLGNVAQIGGAMYHYSGTVLVNNALFARNVATSTMGVGLFVATPNEELAALVIQSTFANHTQTTGSAIHVLGGVALVFNTIVANYGVGIASQESLVAEGFNLFFGNGDNLSTSPCGFFLETAGVAGLRRLSSTLAGLGTGVPGVAYGDVPSKLDAICLEPPAPGASGKSSAKPGIATADLNMLLARMSRLAPGESATTAGNRERVDWLRHAYASRIAGNVPRKPAPVPAPSPVLINRAPLTGAIYSAGTSLTLDPIFVDPAADDYHLTSASPAINIGMDPGVDAEHEFAFVLRDADGEARPLSGGFDAGFDEVALPSRCYATADDGVTVFESHTASAVQQAVATSPLTGMIKVAGYCAGVQAGHFTTQTLYIDQPLIVRGGYTSTDWLTSDPIANPTVLDAQYLGRVVYITGTHGTLESMTVLQGADPESNGGGIYAGQSLTLTSMVVSSNNSLSELHRDWEDWQTGGGGAYVGGDLTLSSTTFISNVSIIGGGAFVNGSVHAVSSTFRSNLAYIGGGLMVSETAHVADSVFDENLAVGGAGLVLGSWYDFLMTGSEVTRSITNPGQILKSRFVNNHGLELGGGLWIMWPTQVADSTFQDNLGGAGAGIAAFAQLTVTRGMFENNQSSAGAGMYLLAPAMISNTRLLSNSAEAGAGIYAEHEASLYLANALFARNTATSAGAAVYMSSNADIDVVHTTIVSPTVSSVSAIHVATGTLSITNSIIASHTVGIWADDGAVIEDANVFFANGSNLSNTIASTVMSGGHSIAGDPAFRDIETDNYRLNPASVAIDLGVDAGVYADIDDEPRPQRLGFDAGYSELHYETITGLQAASDSPTAVGQVTYFTASVATGSQVTYTWDFGDGSMGSGATAAHIYAHAGAHTVTVTAANVLTAVRASLPVSIIPKILLPLVMSNLARGPDLVVVTMTVSPQSGLVTNSPVVIEVAVKNQGASPAGGFWVDLYLDPQSVPAPNATWPLLCATPWPDANCYGGAWYVAQTVQPGQTITLTSADLPADASYSHWLSRIPFAGTHSLYAFVDVYAEYGQHGLIHELDDGNNLFGPVSVTVAQPTRASRSATTSHDPAPGKLQPRSAVQSKQS